MQRIGREVEDYNNKVKKREKTVRKCSFVSTIEWYKNEFIKK